MSFETPVPPAEWRRLWNGDWSFRYAGHRVDVRLPDAAPPEQPHLAHFAGMPEGPVLAVDGPIDPDPGSILPRASIHLEGALEFQAMRDRDHYVHEAHDRFEDMPDWVQEELLARDDGPLLGCQSGFLNVGPRRSMISDENLLWGALDELLLRLEFETRMAHDA